MSFNNNDYVSYLRGLTLRKGYVRDSQKLPSGVVRVIILEDGGGAYHIDERNVTLITHAPSLTLNAYGISTGGGIQYEDSTSLSKDLDALQAAGVKWLRFDMNWPQIESTLGTYDWTRHDPVVLGCLSRGIKVLGMIGYTPSWARPAGATDKSPPTNVGNYGLFCKAVVTRYGGTVGNWEIWNEPNTTEFWQPKPDPVAYTALLKAGYTAIKSVDPNATVISGGLSPAPSDGTQIAPVDFLKAVYANGGKGNFDAVGHHPYCYPAYPGSSDTWSSWYQMVNLVRPLMVQNGDADKRVWATEFGVPTGGTGAVSEATQADMLAKAYPLFRSYSWAGPLFWYQHRDQGANDSFGLLRSDFSTKPSYAAYRAAAIN